MPRAGTRGRPGRHILVTAVTDWSSDIRGFFRQNSRSVFVIHRLRGGAMHAQVEDVLACMPNLVRFARRLSRGEEVEDLVQETVARALGNLDRYQPTGDLKAWLFTIMKNYARDQWRKRRNLATVSLTQATEIETRGVAAPQIERLVLRELSDA